MVLSTCSAIHLEIKLHPEQGIVDNDPERLIFYALHEFNGITLNKAVRICITIYRKLVTKHKLIFNGF